MPSRPDSGGRRAGRFLLGFVATFACVSTAPAQTSLSLDEAIRQARSANARLPLRALEVSLARQRQSEALAERWLKVAVEGGFLYAPAGGYDPILTNLGEARLQVVARQPIYQGGALKAMAARADAGFEAASARYRMADKDLDLEVRSRFAELVAARAEAAVRREGVQRLSNYRALLKSRQAYGQGVAADVLKTEVRIALEEAAVAEAEERQDQSRLALNELMGKDPAAPLEPEPLAAPEAPATSSASAWQGVPEIAAAEADARSAQAELTIARSERKPHLFFNADLGFWVSDTTNLGSEFWDRFWAAKGYSLSLVMAWPVWDTGAFRARVAQADLGLQQARFQVEVERRDARLAWTQAETAMRHLFRQLEILSRAAPDARDSYLEMESRYRGGTASALEVLDAFGAAVDASSRLIDVTARYRVAQAVAIRWSTP